MSTSDKGGSSEGDCDDDGDGSWPLAVAVEVMAVVKVAGVACVFSCPASLGKLGGLGVWLIISAREYESTTDFPFSVFSCY